MKENDDTIAPSMVYAYASLMENVPFANGAPNLTLDIPAIPRIRRCSAVSYGCTLHTRLHCRNFSEPRP